jgi:hypothetical protein
MMGLLGDKKKAAQLILSEAPKKQEKDVPQGIEADFSQAHDAIAKDIIDAVQAGDPGMVSRALKQFVKLCSKEDEYSVDEVE